MASGHRRTASDPVADVSTSNPIPGDILESIDRLEHVPNVDLVSEVARITGAWREHVARSGDPGLAGLLGVGRLQRAAQTEQEKNLGQVLTELAAFATQVQFMRMRHAATTAQVEGSRDELARLQEDVQYKEALNAALQEEIGKLAVVAPAAGPAGDPSRGAGDAREMERDLSASRDSLSLRPDSLMQVESLGARVMSGDRATPMDFGESVDMIDLPRLAGSAGEADPPVPDNSQGTMSFM